MSFRLVVKTEPTVEPVTVTEMQTHLRIADDLDDSTLEGLIEAARYNVAQKQKRSIITTTFTYSRDTFPAGPIFLPNPPLQSVTTLKYFDLDGVQQTWDASNYAVDTSGVIGSLRPVPLVQYPSVQSGKLNAIEIEYVAGWGDAASDVPESTKLAIKMLASHWFEAREPVVTGTIVAVLPFHVESLINTEAVKSFEPFD